MSTRPVAFDMETGDPDDVMTLLLLAASQEIELKAVTLTPGSREQVELVKWILQTLDMPDVSVGAQEWPKFAEKRCMRGHFYESFGRVAVADSECKPAAEVLAGCCAANPSLTLLTGAPLHNLCAAMKVPGFQLGCWVAQGGFAGEGVVPCEVQMEKFLGKATESTWNFGGNVGAALDALSCHSIAHRLLVSKNVCHRAVYNTAFHSQLSVAAASAVGRRGKALQLLFTSMDSYLGCKPSGKTMHDPTALAALLDPSIFKTAEVRVYVDKGRWGSQLASGTGTHIVVDYNDTAFRAALLRDPETRVSATLVVNEETESDALRCEELRVPLQALAKRWR